MLTLNVVRNFGAIVLARTYLTGNSPTGQQDDTAMGNYDDYVDTGAPAPYPSTPAQPQPQPSSRDRTHRSERDRERDRSDRDRDEPSRRSKHSRR